ELMVPLTSSPGSPLVVEGVVGVESRATLTEGQLRRTELVANLYQKLSAALRPGALPPEDREALEAWLSTADAIPTFQRLSKRSRDWARRTLDADVVYLCIYDARRHLFRPVGITLSSRVLLRFFQNPHEVTHLGLDQFDPGEAQRLVRQYEASGGAR